MTALRRFFVSAGVAAFSYWFFERLPLAPEFTAVCEQTAFFDLQGADGRLLFPDCLPGLVARNNPALYTILVWLSFFAPLLVTYVLLSLAETVIALWLAKFLDIRTRGKLPVWPLDPTDKAPALVIGELHYKNKLKEAPHPRWLIMPEKGLYTGLAIFGAIGTGKTTSCMKPFTRQLLQWQNHNPAKRVAMLLLEVKGDFCYDVQEMLEEMGRTPDYMQLSLDTDGWQWNPLNAPWLDTYSLAYTLSSLVNQLFGKGKEPFWQQAYTSTIKWIIECFRSFPDPWFTFADIHEAMVSAPRLAALVDQNTRQTFDKFRFLIEVEEDTYLQYQERLSSVTVTAEDVKAALALPNRPDGKPPPRPPEAVLGPEGAPGVVDVEWEFYRGRYVARLGDVGYNVLAWEMNKAPVIDFANYILEKPEDDELLLTTKIIQWYQDEWLGLDDKLRSSIVTGMSVFLGIFVVPDVARIFCPPNPKDMTEEQLKRLMPPLDQVIETGKVLALNMPAGANPALARASGVMLKQSWLSTLLLRPKRMKVEAALAKKEGRAPNPFRPAVFVCDEYQAFVTCGEDDPSGDEKSFALTRQSKCVPIVATQSIASLKSVLGEGESWRALLQTLRSRIFLSLADDFSQQTASKLLGEVDRMRASFSLSENTGKASASMLTGKLGGGVASAGMSKSYARKREPLFHPRDLSLLGVCQAVAQIFDGAKVHDAQYVFLKADYRPRDEPYWKWKAEMDRQTL